MDYKYRLFRRKTAYGDKINPKLTFILESAENKAGYKFDLILADHLFSGN